MSALLTLFDENPLTQVIRSLFASGEQGLIYDPSDFSTLYQDSAGTTPVTAVGQPVGLALDKRLGLALGPELSPNGGTFDDAAGWTITHPTSSISGGVLNVGAGACDIFPTTASVVVGKSYEVTFTISNSTANYGIRILNRDIIGYGNFFPNGLYITANGSYRFVCVAISNGSIGVNRVSGHTGSLQVDNFSVKEIPGNHAYQTTSPARSTAQTNYLSLDKTDDHLLVAAGGAGTTGFLLVAGIMVPAAGTARTLWSDRGTNTGYKVGIDASNQIVFSAGDGAAFTTVTGPALVAGTKYVITAWHDGANLNISVNNGAPTQAAFVTATAGTATFTIGKSNGAATEYWGDRIYGMVYRKNDTSAASQRSSLYSYMVGKMGGL